MTATIIEGFFVISGGDVPRLSPSRQFIHRQLETGRTYEVEEARAAGRGDVDRHTRHGVGGAVRSKWTAAHERGQIKLMEAAG